MFWVLCNTEKKKQKEKEGKFNYFEIYHNNYNFKTDSNVMTPVPAYINDQEFVL